MQQAREDTPTFVDQQGSLQCWQLIIHWYYFWQILLLLTFSKQPSRSTCQLYGICMSQNTSIMSLLSGSPHSFSSSWGASRNIKHPPTLPRIHLLITIQILHATWRLLTQKPPFHANTILSAAWCLALFKFLCVSEFIVLNKRSHDSSCHLALQDIAIYNRDYTWLLQAVLKQSKTNPLRKGAKSNIGATNGTICPIKAILWYLL